MLEGAYWVILEVWAFRGGWTAGFAYTAQELTYGDALGYSNIAQDLTDRDTPGHIVTAGRIPIRPHPKPIRIQNSDGWAFLTSVSAPRFPIQRVIGMGFLDRGQSKVTALLCSTAVSFRPSLLSRKNHAISLGLHHFYSCGGPLLTVAPVLLPSAPSAQALSSVHSTAPEAQMSLRWGSNEAPSHTAWKRGLFGVSGAPPPSFHRTQPPSWPIGKWTALSPNLFSERAAEAGTWSQRGIKNRLKWAWEAQMRRSVEWTLDGACMACTDEC